MDYNVVFEYNNIEKPFLVVKIYEEGKLINRGRISLSSIPMKNGLPEDKQSFITNISNILNSKNITRNKVLFLVNCSQLTKITFTLPKLNDRKIKKLYENEINTRISDFENYARASYESENDKERIFYEYLLDKEYINYFRRVGEQLGFETIDFNLFSDYLFSIVKANFAEDNYCYLYEEGDVVSMLLVINSSLCSFASFLNTEANYNLYLTSILDNHYQNLEKVKVDVIHANKELLYLK